MVEEGVEPLVADDDSGGVSEVDSAAIPVAAVSSFGPVDDDPDDPPAPPVPPRSSARRAVKRSSDRIAESPSAADGAPAAVIDVSSGCSSNDSETRRKSSGVRCCPLCGKVFPAHYGPTERELHGNACLARVEGTAPAAPTRKPRKGPDISSFFNKVDKT